MARRPAEARDAQGLRPLGLPRAVRVRADTDGVPIAVTLEGGRRTLEVERVLELWRIVEGWWREAPADRTYYRVAVDGGRALTLFRDESFRDESFRDESFRDDAERASGGRWYEQRE
ncbi:MAG: hypothetical protein O3C25_01480 [Chloroflexi bacterium]|nr:hypothetical protein [Chloroflexota bacterium]